MATMSTIPYESYTGLNAPSHPEIPWIGQAHIGAAQGPYCHRHNSWMCGNGQGECQLEFLFALSEMWGWRA